MSEDNWYKHMAVINSILNLINYKRLNQIDEFCKYPEKIQGESLQELLETASGTEYGKKFRFNKIRNYEDFAKNVPINEYESLKPFITRILNGEDNVLWPTEIRWFAKSSGTTSDRSKFIPISKEALEDCHFRSGKDIYAMYADHNPESRVFAGKSLALGGSHQVNSLSPKAQYGDLSAVIIRNLPFWTYFHRIPRQEIALMEEWEEKLERISKIAISRNVTNIVGVPSWFLVLLKRILEKTGKKHILEVWPNLELFIHGGVSFEPYRSMYRKLIPSEEMNYLETYNASEGFFGIQDDPERKDMLLMLDYGIFYEFIPMDQFDSDNPEVLPLSGVKTAVNYAMIITTNSGLWRYMIGDTVVFTSTSPYRIKVTGRTKHFINAFGEEVIIDNAQQALQSACEETHAEIREYTAAPVYFDENTKAAHQWLFEFMTQPDDIDRFRSILDRRLRELNSDYDAKRYKNITLGPPEIVVLKSGVFHEWLKQKNKIGGQHKVPRLANHRKHADALLQLNESV